LVPSALWQAAQAAADAGGSALAAEANRLQAIASPAGIRTSRFMETLLLINQREQIEREPDG
jgi:hypothetical protein